MNSSRYCVVVFGWLLSAPVFFVGGAMGGEGDWPEPRQNHCLTAIQPVPGHLQGPPRVRATLDLGRSRPAITPAVLGDGRTHVALCCVAGQLQCYDTAGQLRWHSHPPGLNFTTIQAVEDLDGDGHPEILLTAGRPQQPFGAAVLVALATGKVLWRYDVEPMSYAWYLYAGRYLPGKKSKQIVVVMQGYPPDKYNGYIALFEYPAPGSSPQQKWRYDFDKYTCFPALLQTDVDGDGVKELVVETHSRMWFLDVRTGALKQFAQWDVAPANVRSYGYNRFVDLDGDGREDFLCIANFAQHHEVLLNRNGTMQEAWHHGWPASVTTGKIVTTWPVPPQADIDGDGRLEIVVSMFHSDKKADWLVRVYDAVTGKLKYRRPGVIAVACADVDGNGAAEILGNRSHDPTRTRCDGAVLLAVRDARLQVVWHDHRAKAPDPMPAWDRAHTRPTPPGGRPVARPVRVQRDGQTLVLAKGSRGKFVLQPWRPPTPAATTDFSAVPPVQGPPAPTLLAGDLTGNGRNELVLHSGATVRVLHLTRKGFAPTGTYHSDAVPVLADMDGDGHLELVTMDVTPTTRPIVQAVTPALGNQRLWRSVFPPAGRLGLPAPRKAYLRTIHLTGKPTPDLYVWAGTPQVRSVGLDGRTGKILWEKSEMPPSATHQQHRYFGPSMNDASAWDFNGDGAEDLVFTNPDYYCVADGPTGDLLLGPLFPKDIFHQPSQGLYTCPVILAERQGPPTVCLVAGHYFQAAMSLQARPYWYHLPVAGENRSAREGFLQTGDGTWLMGFGRQNGNFACVRVKDGSVRWELPLAATASDVVTCDINGDGRGEFIFGTSHGTLYAVGDQGNRPHLVWKTKVGAVTGAPMVADLDGDGACEIVVTTADGRLRVLAGGGGSAGNHGAGHVFQQRHRGGNKRPVAKK